MLRKAIYGTVGLCLLGGLVFGRDAFSYFRTSCASVRDAIKSEVPIDFEIARAREMVENLVPDIRKCMHVIAEEEVNVEDLTAEVARKETELNRHKDQILALRSELGNGNKTHRIVNRVYTSDEVKRDLSQRFDRFKVAEETLSSKKQILNARGKSLAAAREKLEGMLSSKQDLEVQIEHLEARLKTLQAAETASHVNIDDSQLARAKKLIRDLNKQLDVKERMLDAEGKITGLIPIETASEVPADLSEQIDTYFERNGHEQPAVAGK